MNVVSNDSVIGCWLGVIRVGVRAKTMKNLRKLFGDEWVEKEVLCSKPGHPLGKWHKKNPKNPVTKYTDELVEVCSPSRCTQM
jgi:hypothetical protein